MTRGLLVSLLIFGLLGCGGLDYKTLEGYMQAGNCPLAAGHIEKKERAYGSNGRLLFLLDSAQINMLCGNYEKSNEYFHSAEELAEELWTKSITQEAAAFLLNDYTRPYAGEDFERALINLFSAINYLMLGEYDEAVVECRRLDANLSMFNDKYGEKNVYKEDAFGRYLSGMIYESVHEPNDAFIDYYKAYRTFKDYEANYGTPVPPILVEDLLRLAQATHRLDELEELGIEVASSNPEGTTTSLRALTGDYPDSEPPHKSQNKKGSVPPGKIVFIHFNGKPPVKEEDVVSIATKHGPVTLAFPRYVVTRPFCRQSELLIEPEDGEAKGLLTYLVEDINSIAVKNLDDRKGRIIAKTIARAIAKQTAVKKATKSHTARLLFNIVNLALERADTRSWRTLPGEIYLTRVFLPKGSYNTYIRLCGGQRKYINRVDVKAGETKFLFYESVY